MTRRQMIVVVHGVGVRQPGVATGQLSALLTGADPARTDGDWAWKPHSTDDFMLHEDRPDPEGDRLARVFPAHLRRFRRPSEREGELEERVVADFYWGDISGSAASGLGLLGGVVRIILGLAHAVRENAWEVFPGDGSKDRALRRMAQVSALILHGPVAAINLVLLCGVALTLLWHSMNMRALAEVPLPELGPFWTELVLGLGAVAAGLALRRQAQVFLLQILGGWLMAVGALVIGVDVMQRVLPGWAGAILDWAVWLGWPPAASPEIAAQGFGVPAVVLLAGMILAWSVSLALTWVVRLAIWIRGVPQGVASFVPEALVLMSVAWMLLMTVIWALALVLHLMVAGATGWHLPLGLDPGQVVAGLRFVTPAFLALAGVILAGIVVQIGKIRRFGSGGFRPQDYLKSANALAETYRMIVARHMLLALNLFLILLTLLFLAFVLSDCDLFGIALCQDLRAANALVLPFLLPLSGLLGLALVFAGQRGVATAVAIVTDVLAYLNDYSWTTRERTRGRGLVPAGPGQKVGYWLRHRMHARMCRLVERLIADEQPQEIVIVAHSQGTVIALEVIALAAEEWREQLGGGLDLRLVTMGSPYTHLYSHYFPGAFRDTQKRPELAPGGLMRDWVNIFRVDDFVGTFVDQHITESGAARWPREHPVGPGGHSNYWVDHEVIAILRPFLRFVRSDRE